MPLIHQLHAAEVAAGVPQGTLQVAGGGKPADPLSVSRRLRCRSDYLAGVKRQSLGTLERHWTADEMLQRAKAADQMTSDEFAKVSAHTSVASLAPAERRKAWGEASSAANARHLEHGVAGLPVYAQLHYFRNEPSSLHHLYSWACLLFGRRDFHTACPHAPDLICRYENFCHFAVAHLFLYGLLKDFFSVWSDAGQPKRRGDLRDVRRPDGKVVQRAIYAWPAYIIKFLKKRMQAIIPTRQWSIAGASVTR